MNNLFVCPQIKDFRFGWKGCDIFFANRTTQGKLFDTYDWCFRRIFNGRKLLCFPFGAITTLSRKWEIELYNGDVLVLIVENANHIGAYSLDANTEKQKISKKKRIDAYEDKRKRIKDEIWSNLTIQLNEYWEK